MNIIVRNCCSDTFVCRPDTTWERENRDFFSPDFVSEISLCPVVFARVCKAGKCIGKKFAGRYYDGVGFGVLIYPENFIRDNGQYGYAMASMTDHTSVLPFPIYNPAVLETEGNIFTLSEDGVTVFECSTGVGLKEMLEETLVKASGIISMRTGDIICAELSERKAAADSAKVTTVSGKFCDSNIMDFRICR